MGFGALSQLIRVDNYRGKRVRFSAYVKTRAVEGTGAGLWMRIDGDGGLLQFDNMQSRRITGTADWRLVSVVLDVPNNAAGIAIGLLLSGSGEAWIDDASFDVVGSDVPSTNTAQPSTNPDNAEQQRRAYEAVPLAPRNMGFEPG
jgi:hypothetical protein